MIAGAGFDAVTLWWGDAFERTNGPKARLPDLARRAGLWVENVHTDPGGAGLLWADTLDGEAVLGRYLQSVEDCRAHGIPAMVVHLTGRQAPPPPGSVGIARLLRLVERAEDAGVRVALENVRYGGYVDYALARIPSRCLGLCYDSGHAHCFTPGDDPLPRWTHRLMALHLHDNDGTRDAHRLPGQGTIDWQAVAREIARGGYTGPVTLEASSEHSPQDRDAPPAAFLSRACESARWLAGLCAGQGPGEG